MHQAALIEPVIPLRMKASGTCRCVKSQGWYFRHVLQTITLVWHERPFQMLFSRIAAGALALGLFVVPAFAKNFAVPAKNPSITITLPNDWSSEDIEYGFQARPKDEGVFFPVESAEARQIDTMLADTKTWMRDNKIKAVEPIKADMKISGIDSTVFQFRTSDENGPTTVDLILMPAGNGRVMMLTVWGNDAEREANGKALDAIFGSIKPIN